jgi:hypothetical protein
MDAIGTDPRAGFRYSRYSVSYVARVLGARSTRRGQELLGVCAERDPPERGIDVGAPDRRRLIVARNL